VRGGSHDRLVISVLPYFLNKFAAVVVGSLRALSFNEGNYLLTDLLFCCFTVLLVNRFAGQYTCDFIGCVSVCERAYYTLRDFRSASITIS